MSTKIVVGYYVHWKGDADTRPPSITLSIQGGMQAIKRWNEGEKVLLIGGNAHSFSLVGNIVKKFAFGATEERLAIENNTGMTEEAADLALQGVLNGLAPSFNALAPGVASPFVKPAPVAQLPIAPASYKKPLTEQEKAVHTKRIMEIKSRIGNARKAEKEVTPT